MAHGPKLACNLKICTKKKKFCDMWKLYKIQTSLSQRKFYWNTTTHPHLAVLVLAELSSCDRGVWPTKPEIFTTWPFTEKVWLWFSPATSKTRSGTISKSSAFVLLIHSKNFSAISNLGVFFNLSIILKYIIHILGYP